MKNKKLKIFLAIILTLILLVLINILRNYFIVKKLYETSQNHSINFNNLHYTHKITLPFQSKTDGTIGVIDIENYYFKDNIVRTNFTSNFTGDEDPIIENTWKNLETDEFLFKSTLENEPNVDEDESDSNSDYTRDVNSCLLHNYTIQNINQLLKQNIFSIITSDSENHYKLRFGEYYLYVNKTTGIIANRTHIHGDSIIEYTIKENVVTDEDVAKF